MKFGELKMKKLNLIVAAVAVLGIVAPTLASAETVVIKHRDSGFRNAHNEMHRHHGWHHHDKKVVVIKKGHHHT
jgi:hypothetical protein